MSIRPPFAKLLRDGAMGINRGRPSAGSSVLYEPWLEEDEVDPVETIVMPAIGDEVCLTHDDVIDGSLMLEGEYEEDIDYSVDYETGCITNLTITPGTSIDVEYEWEEESTGGGGTGGGGLPRECILAGETFTVAQCEQMAVHGGSVFCEGTLVLEGTLMILE